MNHGDPLDEELSHRRSAAGENRLPPAVAVVVAAVAYALLPESLLLVPRLVISIVELVLLAALIVTNPRRMVRQSRWAHRRRCPDLSGHRGKPGCLGHAHFYVGLG